MTGPKDEQENMSFLNLDQRESVYYFSDRATNVLLYCIFSSILTHSMEAETIFKAISALASYGPLFTSASHTHLFSTQS